MIQRIHFPLRILSRKGFLLRCSMGYNEVFNTDEDPWRPPGGYDFSRGTRKAMYGARGSKRFYKCKRCYASGSWCKHKSSKGSSYKKGVYGASRNRYPKSSRRSYSKRFPKRGMKRSSKQPVEKVDLPVLGSEKEPWIDCIPLNGVRVRSVWLTHPQVLTYESKKFAGVVCWRGVTEKFDFELNGEGPFLHRRILFQSSGDWSFRPVSLTQTALPASSWHRHPTVRVTGSRISDDLRRLFGQNATVRTLLFGSVVAHDVTVLEDSRKSLQGRQSGLRRHAKYWNGFGKNQNGSVLKYDRDESGAVETTILDGSAGRHIYLVDIFQYGINGLDVPMSNPVVSDKKRSLDGDVKSTQKRQMSDESYVMNMDGVESSLPVDWVDDMAAIESAQSGIVRVISNMKLYWYDPK